MHTIKARRKRYRAHPSREAFESQRHVVRRTGQALAFLITLGSSILSFIQFGLSWKILAVVVLIGVFLASLLGNVMFLMARRMQEAKPKQIAFLTPSSGGQSFYTAMLTGLVRSASLALGQDYLIVPSMPTESFEAVSIWSLFAGLEDRQVDIDGIIFIPDNPDSHFDEIVGFHEKRGDIPLVLIDVYFDLDGCDQRTRTRLPSFVGGDEVSGGTIAAELAIAAVGPDLGSAPVVLVVNGGVAAWERQRASAFREKIRLEWPDVQFIETPHFNYSRQAAKNHCDGLLRSMADNQGQIDLHAVFACNDDMAIGVRGAIGQALRDGLTFTRPPQIIGYDGIPEICEYISAGDPYIAGTVDVRVEDQARQAILLMHKLIRSGERKAEVVLVPPHTIARQRVNLTPARR